MSVQITDELIDMHDLGRILKVHSKTVSKLNVAGKIPAPLHPTGTTACRWRRSEIEAWIAAGCPSRAEWEASRQAGAKSRR